MLADLGLPAAVVFDMDGTLLESERLARACFLAACQDAGWGDVDSKVYDRCVGSTHAMTREILLAGYGASFPVDEVEAHWSRRYHQHIERRPLDIKPGVLELMQRLDQRGIPMALATSSLRPTATTKLTMAGLMDFFHHLVCGGEAEQGKPHPAPYLKATTQLDVAPAQCWALEDSDNGVRSAYAAGLQVIQIPDELAPSDEVRNFGHPILHSAQVLLTLLD